MFCGNGGSLWIIILIFILFIFAGDSFGGCGSCGCNNGCNGGCGC